MAISVTSFLVIISSPLLLKLQFNGDAKKFVIISMVTAILNFTSSLLMIVQFDLGVGGLFFGQLVGQGFGTIILFCVCVRFLNPGHISHLCCGHRAIC